MGPYLKLFWVCIQKWHCWLIRWFKVNFFWGIAMLVSISAASFCLPTYIVSMTNIFVDTCYIVCIHVTTSTLISTSLFYFSEENVNCSVVSYTLWPHGLYFSPWDPPGKNTGVGHHSLLQGIFLTQGLIPGLPHCRQILYHLSHQGRAWGKLLTWKKKKEQQ